MAAAPKPKNATEVKSFLCSVLFSSKFIPDFATITQPLWELSHDNTTWKWTKEEQRAFDEVKRRLTRAPIMAYYRLDADTRIVTDALPVGLGVVLKKSRTMGSISCYVRRTAVNTVKSNEAARIGQVKSSLMPRMP